MSTELIIGNSNKRFSGVTSTMLQVLEWQKSKISLVVLGDHHLSDKTMSVGFFEAIKICKEPLSDERFRVFHARRNDEMIQALLLKWLSGAKLKIAFTSTAQRFHSNFTRWLMSKMDAIISTCNAAADFLPIPPDAIIPHGVDTGVYSPDAARESISSSLPGKIRIGIFGRVRKQKGVDLLIKAAIPLLQENSDLSVVVVGEITEDNKPFVADLIAELVSASVADQVVFLGKQLFADIPALFCAMDIVTALSINEGFGLTVLEAMSSGVPVVATEAGAWPEIVENGIDGYVVPVGDEAAVRGWLELMLSDFERLAEMGACARKKIENNYSVQREAGLLVDFFRTLSRAD